jgi:Tfp pilus assembly protein PilV
MKRARGTMLLEVSLSLILAATAMVTIAQLVIISSRQRREAEWTSLATREAGNLMERAMMHSWQDLTTDQLSQLTISKEAAQRLRGAELSIAVTEDDARPRQKEISVLVRWNNLADLPADPVSLSAWVFAPEEIR